MPPSLDKTNWDLTPLYAAPDDHNLQNDLAAASQEAKQFRSAFYGQINCSGVTASTLSEALRQYEALQLKVLRPYLYAQLLFYAESSKPEHTRLVAQVREAWQAIHEETLFFELEILALADDVFASLIVDAAVTPYAHYLTTVRAHAPYTLGESVEQALKRKDLSGKDAFVQLFDELTAGLTYRFHFPGEKEEREATGEELLSLIYHQERDVREAAFATFLDKHAKQSLVLTSCFNNILLDHGKESELRNYPDLMTPTHLSSETAPEMVEQMLAVTEAHYPLAQEYFELKRQLLGYEKLKNTDLYAPVAKESRKYSFAEALELVVNSFRDFDPGMADIVERLVATGRLDVSPRTGKSGGAFCMGLYPGADPYVLLNFTGTLRDVSTLAHELGHAVHYVLSSEQNFFHYHAPLPLAETASVFAEMLLTRTLLDQEPDRQTRIALLCAKVEDIIATTFRQTVLTRFEQAAHARRGQELLAADDFCELWLAENARLLGDRVEMIPAYRWGWSYISHFIHARFYCYSYVFGELLVLALYQKYRAEGSVFVPDYRELLSAGGSVRPDALLKPMGIDLNSADFWTQGYGLVRELIEELRLLVLEE
ncbi:MAG: M3 family oligoendopeptidase [Desulfuromonadales bacterium]|nr:M3 family oligoendopeptidase [Desulfuromonadales bacterium]